MILILVQKVANRRLISGEDLFIFFMEIIIILMQKVGCFLYTARQIFFVRQNGPRFKKVGHPCTSMK